MFSTFMWATADKMERLAGDTAVDPSKADCQKLPILGVSSSMRRLLPITTKRLAIGKKPQRCIYGSFRSAQNSILSIDCGTMLRPFFMYFLER